jgi:selenocysteine lyase/cysteine desulfurase
MDIDRRTLLTGLGGVTAAAAAFGRPPALDAASTFPRKADFAIEEGYTYISGAFTHPMPIAAAQAYRDAVNRRGTIGAAPPAARAYVASGFSRTVVDPKAAFAALVNAKPSEISYIPNTSTGENLVVECLGIRSSTATS